MLLACRFGSHGDGGNSVRSYRTGQDMAVLNSTTKRLTPDAVALVPLLEFFVGPLPGVLPGFISCQCLAFWAGVKLL